MKKSLLIAKGPKALKAKECLYNCGMIWNEALAMFACEPNKFNFNLWYEHFCNRAKNGKSRSTLCSQIYLESYHGSI